MDGRDCVASLERFLMTDPGKWRTILDPARCAAPDCHGLNYPDKVLTFKNGAVMCESHGNVYISEMQAAKDVVEPDPPKENRKERRRKVADKVVPA